MTTLADPPRDYDWMTAIEREEFREPVGSAESALQDEQAALHEPGPRAKSVSGSP